MFTHPALLWGLLFLTIPVIIHLINLFRHRRVAWGAMEFLLAAFRRHRTRMRMVELLLLLLRLGIVTWVVLLVAMPVLKSRFATLLGGVRTHHVVILDDSFSMSDRVDASDVFATAKRVVEQLVAESVGQPSEQMFTLLRTSRSRGESLECDFHAVRLDSDFPTRLGSALDSLSASESAFDAVHALARVGDVAPAEKNVHRVVYVVSDFRKRDWSENPELGQTLEPLKKEGVAVWLLDAAETLHENLGISDLVPGATTRAAGVPLEMTFRVTNFGASPAKNVVVHPSLAEPGGATQTLPAITIPEIPAGGSVRERFPVVFPGAGTPSVVVSLDPDTVSADNVAYAVVEIPPFESALVIDASPGATASKPLRTALAPGGSVNTGLVLRVESPRFLSTQSLASFRTIYLVDVPALDTRAVTAVEDFLRAGGGVGVFAGPNTDPILALRWHREGAGFFPVMLGNSTDLAVDYLQKIPDLRVSQHPIFKVFGSGERSAAFLMGVNVARYYTLEDESQERLIPMTDQAPELGHGDVRILATLRNNAPLVLESRFGAGRVVVFLTTADAQWNSWARGNPSFVVAMLEMQAYLAHYGTADEAGGDSAAARRTVGQTLETRFSPGDYGPEFRFFTPDGAVFESGTALLGKDGRLHATSAPTDHAGVYVLERAPKADAPSRRFFPVNVDATEGALEKIPGEALAQACRGAPVRYLHAEDFRLYDAESGGVPISDWILYILLVWMLLEMLLARYASGHIDQARRERRGA